MIEINGLKKQFQNETVIEYKDITFESGKSYMLLTGNVAAVSAAIESAKQKVGESGLFLDSSVIPNPDKSLWASIL